MKICVMGLGYIGLPTAAMFSNSECEVVGVDVKKEIIEVLNNGNIHIEEPGLADLIRTAVNNKTFRASTEPEEADAYIIGVPTPNKNDGFMSCDLTYVLEACQAIKPYLKKGAVVIVESTISPLSMDDFIKPFFEENGLRVGSDIYLAHCPERVLPGQILNELVNNNRIVGGITPQCAEKSAQIYSVFVKGEIVKTEAKTAEMSKCMENTFRDVNIALANELTKICYDLNINVLDVINMANKHPRVNIHSPGPGVGGHCIAVDPYFIYAKSPQYANMIKLARDTNNSMPQFVVDMVKGLLSNEDNPSKLKIAVFGITYKGNVDDMRESPALEVVEILKKEGYQLAIHDPHVKHDDFVGCDEAVQDADLILVLADHSEFKNYNYSRMAELMRLPRLLDTKNFLALQPESGMEIINFGNAFNFKQSADTLQINLQKA